MKAILVSIDGTICDRSTQLHIINTPEFYDREAILLGIPVPGSAACMQELAQRYQLVYIGALPASALPFTLEWLALNGFPSGPVYLAETQAERFEIVKTIKGEFDFTAGIGDR